MKKGTYKVVILMTTLPKQKKGKNKKVLQGSIGVSITISRKLKPRGQEGVVFSLVSSS